MDTFCVVPVLVPRGLCSTACIVSEKSRGLTARCRWFWLEDPMLLFCTRLPRPAATRVRGGERGSEGHALHQVIISQLTDWRPQFTLTGTFLNQDNWRVTSAIPLVCLVKLQFLAKSLFWCRCHLLRVKRFWPYQLYHPLASRVATPSLFTP